MLLIICKPTKYHGLSYFLDYKIKLEVKSRKKFIIQNYDEFKEFN